MQCTASIWCTALKRIRNYVLGLGELKQPQQFQNSKNMHVDAICLNAGTEHMRVEVTRSTLVTLQPDSYQGLAKAWQLNSWGMQTMRQADERSRKARKLKLR